MWFPSEDVSRTIQLSAGQLTVALPEAILMWCLPAHRGPEITDLAIEGSGRGAGVVTENSLNASKK